MIKNKKFLTTYKGNNMKDLYKQSVLNIRDKLLKEVSMINELSNDKPDWTIPHPIVDSSPKSKGYSVWKSIGVYRIIHKPTNQIVSIGCGNIAARKYRHKSVHLNNGKTLISKNGSPSPSMTGMHMYKMDKDINNWWFSWTHIGSKSLAEQYEILLQNKMKPLFNNLSMAGK